MKQVTIYISAVIMLTFLSATKKEEAASIIEQNAVMPSIAKDKQNVLHLVFAKGNQVWYKRSYNGGLSFSSPSSQSLTKGFVRSLDSAIRLDKSSICIPTLQECLFAVVCVPADSLRSHIRFGKSSINFQPYK